MQLAYGRASRLSRRDVDVRTVERGTSEYEDAKRRVRALVRRRPDLLRTVPAAYVRRLFLEEEDRIDYICTLGEPLVGFALLTDKLLTSWVPPEWKWEYVLDAKHETRYTHRRTGRVVYDDLDEVWRGRDERDDDIFKVRSLHIQLLCAPKGRGAELMRSVEGLARALGIDALSLGAANEELQRLYRERYRFTDTRIGCARRSSASRSVFAEWHRAHTQSDGLYGHLMTRCLRR